MMVKVNRDELSRALRVLERATARRENLFILNGVLLDARNPGTLTLTATDLEIGVRTTLAAEGDGGWARVVDARLLSGLVGRMGGEAVEFRATDRQVVVSSGGTRFALASMDAEEFPELPVPQAKVAVRLEAERLATTLRRVAFAAAESDQRPVLAGVFVEIGPSAIALAATDSSRLAAETLELGEPVTALNGETVQIIIPRRLVDEAARILEAVAHGAEVVLEADDRIAAVKADRYVLTTRLIEGAFPPYRNALLNDPPHVVRFERRPLLDAIGRLSLLSRRGPAVIVFEPASEPGMVALRAAEADVGEGVEALRIMDGLWPAGVRVAYQARFIEEFLKAVPSETVWYAFADPARQCQWTMAGSDYRYIVMPVRLDEGAMARAA